MLYDALSYEAETSGCGRRCRGGSYGGRRRSDLCTAMPSRRSDIIAPIPFIQIYYTVQMLFSYKGHLLHSFQLQAFLLMPPTLMHTQ